MYSQPIGKSGSKPGANRDVARVFRQGSQRRSGPTLTLVLTLALGCLVWGCGVKGPPVPLRQPPPLPAVADLTYRVADRRVTLTWRLTAPLDNPTARQASFIVRRSQTALVAPACENCPLTFETVGRVPYVETVDNTHAFTHPLETGYRYGFTVHLKANAGAGPESSPVRFDTLSDGAVVPVEEP